MSHEWLNATKYFELQLQTTSRLRVAIRLKVTLPYIENIAGLQLVPCEYVFGTEKVVSNRGALALDKS